jgi:hypothetical protein
MWWCRSRVSVCPVRTESTHTVRDTITKPRFSFRHLSFLTKHLHAVNIIFPFYKMHVLRSSAVGAWPAKERERKTRCFMLYCWTHLGLRRTVRHGALSTSRFLIVFGFGLSSSSRLALPSCIVHRPPVTSAAPLPLDRTTIPLFTAVPSYKFLYSSPLPPQTLTITSTLVLIYRCVPPLARPRLRNCFILHLQRPHLPPPSNPKSRDKESVW